MALTDLRLSLLAFPQRWDGASRLDLRVLLLPKSNPLVALSPTWPQFAGTQLHLQAALVPSAAGFPQPGDPATKFFPVTTVPPAGAVALFTKLPGGNAIVPDPHRPLDGVQIRKDLPPSYTSAFPFEQPNKFGSTDNLFGCSLRGKNPGGSNPPPPAATSWGQLLSYALRQPVLARALGLLYDISLTLSPALVKDGAWIYFALDTSNSAFPYVKDFLTNNDFVKSDAALLPPLTTARQLFAASLVPVEKTLVNQSLYDDVLIEMEDYNDGFAKIVHCNQPTSTDAAIGDQNQVAAGTDAGVQLGWDDEQVLVWQNRQLNTAFAVQQMRLGKPLPPDFIEAPLGVLGYRVDVRELGAAQFNSLVRVKGNVLVGPPPVPFDGEQSLEPVPVRSQDPTDTLAWLPRYFAQWRGKSLAVADDVATALTGGLKNAPPSFLTPILNPGVGLRYGKTFEFRTRLSDLTGGGPSVNDSAINAGEQPIAQCPFLRYVPPKAARIQPDKPTTPSQISVWRPIIGYPEMMFAGVTDPAVISKLVSLVPAAKAIKGVLGVSDPDVSTLRVVVEVLALGHDQGTPGETKGNLDGAYQVVYTFDRPFPPLKPITPANIQPMDPKNPTAGLDPAESINLQLTYQDIPDVSTLNAPAIADPQPLPIPRGRDVRIRIIPVGVNTPNYFATDQLRFGITSDLTTRQEVQSEPNLFKAINPLKAIYLQPVDNIAQRLAQELQLDNNGLTFSGPVGVRTMLGASKRLRHTLSGDGSSITFASPKEGLGHWIAVIALELNRDWTWDALTRFGFQVDRVLDGVSDTCGNLELTQTASAAALGDAQPPISTKRSFTQLIFFDAIDPNPPSGKFPRPQSVTYTVTPQFQGALSGTPLAFTVSETLPVAVNPSQTPQLVSAGIALSPYQHDPDYTSTEPRQRRLWLEFEEPVKDDNDAYFARVLNYGVDPLLTTLGQAHSIQVPPEPPLPLDPEPIRVITPGQPPDTSGLDAMTKLDAATDTPPGSKPRHFLLPLPPGVDENDPQLFGFWTYEIRVGHANEWSTAQARYGRPLHVSGVQHPAPTLSCLVYRSQKQIVVSAPTATPVFGGLPLLRRAGPQTSIWILLYANVVQADSQSHRNVLLDRQPAFIPEATTTGFFTGAGTRDISAIATFQESSIEQALKLLLLPLTTPLSVLAVEFLPPGTDRPPEPVRDNLGQVRVLRTSPLTPVPAIC